MSGDGEASIGCGEPSRGCWVARESSCKNENRDVWTQWVSCGGVVPRLGYLPVGPLGFSGNPEDAATTSHGFAWKRRGAALIAFNLGVPVRPRGDEVRGFARWVGVPRQNDADSVDNVYRELLRILLESRRSLLGIVSGRRSRRPFGSHQLLATV